MWAIAPGQACVLYDGERCLGGGRIAAAEPETATKATTATDAEPVPGETGRVEVLA